MTKTTHRWNSVPGNFDKLNTFAIFQADNKFGVPTIKDNNFVPDWLVPYNTRIRTDKDISNGAIHTFLDDYRFETLWTRPVDTLSAIKVVGSALSPDFSTYTQYPYALQMWNIYRSRWVGAYWQSHGIRVIPTVSWSDEASYEFCFCGIPKGSTVAIGTVGVVRDSDAVALFKKGYLKMTEVIEPRLVLCYGSKLPFNIEEYNRVKWYPSYWKSIKDAMKGGSE